jgi:nucleoside-diphosphate-sugar epimerase
MELRGESTKVLITGGTGFVGGRLLEVLKGTRGVSVTALVRDFARVARIGRYGVPIVRGDLLEPESFSHALKGVDVVFHCGYGGAKEERDERRANLDGTLNLAKEAVRHGVKRFIHTSTMSIYGHDLPPEVTEATPPRPTTGYGRIKLEIEHALTSFAASSGLDLRMVRPTKVYGPYDYNFSVPVTKKILERRLWMIEEGSGIVTPNYVDNLVHGLMLCAEREGLKGAAYLMADGRSYTWAEFFEYFFRMTGERAIGNVTRADVEAAQRAASKAPSAKAILRATLMNDDARSLYPKFATYRQIRGLVPQGLVDKVKTLDRLPLSQPRAAAPKPAMGEYRDYTRRGAFSTALAERELGYRAKVDIETAMRRTEAWLRFAGVLPSMTPNDAAAFAGVAADANTKSLVG